MKHNISIEIIVPPEEPSEPEERREGLRLTMEEEGIVNVEGKFHGDLRHGNVHIAKLLDAVRSIETAFNDAKRQLS